MRVIVLVAIVVAVAVLSVSRLRTQRETVDSAYERLDAAIENSSLPPIARDELRRDIIRERERRGR